MKNVIIFCLAMFTSFQVVAQQHKISGTIIDSNDGLEMMLVKKCRYEKNCSDIHFSKYVVIICRL